VTFIFQTFTFVGGFLGLIFYILVIFS